MGMGMGAGVGAPGRRKKIKGGIRTPGSNIGGMGSGGSGNAPPPPGVDRTGGTGSSINNRNTKGKDGNGHGKLDSIAPLPDRPLVYPVDSHVYRIPITFEIELLSTPIAPVDNDTANLKTEDGEIGS